MTKFTKILILIGCVGICFLIILLCLYLYSMAKPISEKESILGILLSIMAIIVALGVAHSFISIYTSKEELTKMDMKIKQVADELNQKIANLSNELVDKTSMLDKKSKALFLKRQEQQLEGKAENYYKQSKFIQAIKTELEFIELILLNRPLCDDDFLSHVGSKRSNIANDLLQCRSKLTKKGEYKFDSGEFEDITRTIIRLECALLKSDLVYYFPKYEKERYEYLIRITKSVLGEIFKEVFPINFSTVDLKKLEKYTTITDGTKSDDEQ